MAVTIAERAIALNEEPQLKPYIDLPRMAEITEDMIRNSLDALIHDDVELANRVRREDDIIDKLNEQIFRELLTFIMEDPKTTHRASSSCRSRRTWKGSRTTRKAIADMVWCHGVRDRT
jgi:phosphate transport system protein